MSSIREIVNQSSWDDFVLSVHPNTFLQSWEWGQVQKRAGGSVRYLGIFEADQQIGAALVLTVNARRGKHLFIPHGPIAEDEQQARRILPTLISYCQDMARNERAVALRIAPLLTTSPENTALFSSSGFRPAPLHVHTELTWVLDINKSDDELLAGMRKTTRHAIRKAQEAGVQVEISTDPAAIERFFPLYEATERRHHFVPFSKSFLRDQVTLFAQNGRAYLAFAAHEEKDVAAAIFIHFGDTVFYHHGASVKSSVPAAQLLQWTSIQEAKRCGATRYNFWGIAPENRPRHPFAGITTFKKGFGGYAIDYMHAQDLPLSPLYWTLWGIEMVRKAQRGF